MRCLYCGKEIDVAKGACAEVSSEANSETCSPGCALKYSKFTGRRRIYAIISWIAIAFVVLSLINSDLFFLLILLVFTNGMLLIIIPYVYAGQWFPARMREIICRFLGVLSVIVCVIISVVLYCL